MTGDIKWNIYTLVGTFVMIKQLCLSQYIRPHIRPIYNEAIFLQLAAD